jgi:hypothetical protein
MRPGGMLGGSEANAAEQSEPQEQADDGGASGDFGDSDF